ncbi:DUF4446 family protein [Candidatus Microgenomates bacterium]|nr:DUF4446 family protein [Candidatus Microgenomates bacterium]
MYSDWVWLLLLAVFVWLLVLSFLIWQLRGFLKSLFPKSGERDIRKKFEEITKAVTNFKDQLGELEGKLFQLDKQSLIHIQKVELLRYNPYEDTGGDQSFSVALLDNGGTGIIVTSLHARSSTRVFAKPVIKGKAEKYQFSKEEQQVIDEAMRQKDE